MFPATTSTPPLPSPQGTAITHMTKCGESTAPWGPEPSTSPQASPGPAPPPYPQLSPSRLLSRAPQPSESCCHSPTRQESSWPPPPITPVPSCPKCPSPSCLTLLWVPAHGASPVFLKGEPPALKGGQEASLAPPTNCQAPSLGHMPLGTGLP